MTGQTIVTRAIRKVLMEGRYVPEAGEAADALAELQGLVDQMNAKRGVLFTVGRSTFTWAANQSSRTLGSSGQIAGDRPVWIDSWAVIPVGSSHETVRARPILDAEYAQISDKTQTADYFTRLYYRPTVPNGTLIVHPVPTSAPTLVLYHPSVLSTFADLESEYTAPPGYEDFFVFRLAKRLAVDYGRAWSQELEDELREASATIQIANVTIPQYGPMPAGLRGHRGGSISATQFDSGEF